MSGPLPWLTYLRLKTAAVLLRLSFDISVSIPPWLGGNPYFPPAKTITIPSSKDAKRSIRLHLYTPDGYKDGDILPVHITFAGSGWTANALGTNSEFCAFVTSSLKCIVIDADHAKGPENPFPAAYEDVTDVLAYVLSSPELYDVSRVTMGGFSSGGTLTLSVAALEAIAKDRVRGVVAVYPATNLTTNGQQLADSAPNLPETFPGVLISPWAADFLRSCYIPPGQRKDDPRLSPFFIDPSQFPPVLIITTEYDTLRAEAEALAKKLEEGGAKVVSKRILGVGHGWDLSPYKPGTLPDERKKEAYSVIVQFLSDRWGISS